jgi:hypothetical protein
MLLRRSSAFVNSCRLFWSRSDGRGHGSQDFIEPSVPERARDVGRLRMDAPRWCEGDLRGVAVWGRPFDDPSVSFTKPCIADDVSRERCFEAVGAAMVMAGREDDVEAWTAQAGPVSWASGCFALPASCSRNVSPSMAFLLPLPPLITLFRLPYAD